MCVKTVFLFYQNDNYFSIGAHKKNPAVLDKANFLLQHSKFNFYKNKVFTYQTCFSVYNFSSFRSYIRKKNIFLWHFNLKTILLGSVKRSEMFYIHIILCQQVFTSGFLNYAIILLNTHKKYLKFTEIIHKMMFLVNKYKSCQ